MPGCEPREASIRDSNLDVTLCQIGSCKARGGVRLFTALERIPTRMSATLIWANPGAAESTPNMALPESGATPSAAAKWPTYLFSTLMADDKKSLVQGLRQRDPELLDRLIEQYQYRLFRYLLYITGSPERAEDFFQETWIRVLERGHQYNGKFKFEAWLFTIARNLVIDWQRQKKAVSLDSMTDPEEGKGFEIVDERAESPLTLFLQAESQGRVQASLERLPVAYREVLLLRFQEEMQLDEIARIQATPISTVKSRLYRGLDALKGLLAGGAV
jgi:RNA polymerase sigma-70 factor, ECF subfamily